MLNGVLVLVLSLSLRTNAVAQASPGEISGGTLNLILANKNGFVIASDSRRTQTTTGEYWDDSQKLFRVGPKSAAVISGFASWAAANSPIDLQVAAVLREQLSDPAWTRRKLRFPNLPPMLAITVGEHLSVFGGLQEGTALPASGLDFKFLAAGLEKSKVVLLQVHFEPRIESLGPYDLSFPTYHAVSSTRSVDHFEFLFEGVTDVANAIRNGRFITDDPDISRYYRARQEGTLDSLSIESLEKLATAILVQTEQSTRYVGGPHQIGVFPIRGAVKWSLPDLPTSKQKLRSTVVNVGSSYSWNGFLPTEHAQMKGKRLFATVLVSLVQPFDEPYTQVFMGGLIRDVPVVLNGNVFSRNRFIDVHFRYSGGPYYFDGNFVDGCWMELPEGVDAPKNESLRNCVVERVKTIRLENAVGSPIKAEPKGCVSRNRDGRLVIKTKGRQAGIDCRGSTLTVPRVLGPFQLGPQLRPTKN